MIQTLSRQGEKRLDFYGFYPLNVGLVEVDNRVGRRASKVQLKLELGGGLDDSTKGFDGWFLEETDGDGDGRDDSVQRSRRGIWAVVIESGEVEMEAKG